MEKINLVEILRDCPKNTKLYSLIFGEVEFIGIVNDDNHPISVIDKTGTARNFDAIGKYYHYYNDAECVLFPSKDQRDWTKFKCSKLICHTPNEEPLKDTRILIEVSLFEDKLEYHSYYWCALMCPSWKEFVKKYNVKRWMYISDIFPIINQQ